MSLLDEIFERPSQSEKDGKVVHGDVLIRQPELYDPAKAVSTGSRRADFLLDDGEKDEKPEVKQAKPEEKPKSS